jgi:hypothetical protein
LRRRTKGLISAQWGSPSRRAGEGGLALDVSGRAGRIATP